MRLLEKRGVLSVTFKKKISNQSMIVLHGNRLAQIVFGVCALDGRVDRSDVGGRQVDRFQRFAERRGMRLVFPNRLVFLNLILLG